MDESKMEEDLSAGKTAMLNGLGYRMPPESSVAVRRTHKRQFPQKSTYTSGQEIIIDFNTGAEFVNCHRSWLNLAVSCSAAATFGSRGGAPNLIQRLVLSTRSGVELSRLETANAYYAKKIRYGCSKEYVDQWGETMGYATDTIRPISVNANAPTRYSVPLPFISEFFQGDGKTLLPPQLAAGLRVSITLASDATALVAPAPSTYLVTDISVQTSVSTITDDWQRRLNEMSASQGLTYAYNEIHTTASSLASAQTTVNIQVRKAVSRVLSAQTVSRTTATIGAQTLDSMKSEPFAVSQFQWRLGSIYFPQQPITTDVEAFYIAQNACDGGLVDCRTPNAVSLASFRDSSVGADNGDGVTAVSLERSDIAMNDVLNISGLPSNNSRALDCDITFVAGSDRTTQLYMKHVKIARAFLENVVVSE
jgi:hypothetical protein